MARHRLTAISRPLLWLLPVAWVGTAWAQPISVSMTECSVIYDQMTRFTSPGSTQHRLAKAARMSAVMRDAALSQAQIEGVDDPEAHVASWSVRHDRKWHGRLQDWRHRSDNKDWLDYCAALGKDRGLFPLKQ